MRSQHEIFNRRHCYHAGWFSGEVRVGLSGAYSSGIRRVKITEPNRLAGHLPPFAPLRLNTGYHSRSCHGYYNQAQVCGNGHEIHTAAELISRFENITSPICNKSYFKEQINNLKNIHENCTRGLSLEKIDVGGFSMNRTYSRPL